jgi:hypothetical protein
MNRKYELLSSESISHSGLTLYRIRAVRDFDNVKIGDLGGYVESDNNLSHDGMAWIADQAQVYRQARVEGNARVSGHAQVSGRITLSDNVYVGGWTEVSAVYGRSGRGAQIIGDLQLYAARPDPGPAAARPGQLRPPPSP